MLITDHQYQYCRKIKRSKDTGAWIGDPIPSNNDSIRNSLAHILQQT